MMFEKTAVVLVLAASAAFAQSSSPAATAPKTIQGRRLSALATTPSEDKANEARMQSAMHQRVMEMGKTIGQMQVLLKQMQTKVAASGTKDSLAKANVEMWQLMLTQLDQQFEQLRLATTAREDLEKRRNAMYKQAEMKAAMAAGRAQSEGAASSTTGPAANGQMSQAAQQPSAPQSSTTAARAVSPNK